MGSARTRPGGRASATPSPPLTTRCSRTAGRSRRSGGRRPTPRSESCVDPWPIHPASDDPADVAAAWAEDGVRNRWFFDPLLRGSYPEDVLERFADEAPPVRDGDLATISVPLDFLGVNNYSRRIVRAGLNGTVIDVPAPGGELTDMGWEVYPDGLFDSLRADAPRVRRRVDLRHGERRRVRGRPQPRRPNPRRRADRVPRRLSRRDRERRSPKASRCAATSSGRCSTTSSGRSATPSGSASSTSTTRRSSGCRRTASTGTGT